MIRFILVLFFANLLSIAPTVAKEPSSGDTEKIEYLDQAIVKLRKKTIPQAYFWLGTPQAPDSTMFIPDTKGGGFVIIVKVANKGEQAKVFYKDKDWKHLLQSTKQWKTSKKTVIDLLHSSELSFEKDEILVLQLPKNTEVILKALLSGWRTEKKDFRCSIHWN